MMYEESIYNLLGQRRQEQHQKDMKKYLSPKAIKRMSQRQGRKENTTVNICQKKKHYIQKVKILEILFCDY